MFVMLDGIRYQVHMQQHGVCHKQERGLVALLLLHKLAFAVCLVTVDSLLKRVSNIVQRCQAACYVLLPRQQLSRSVKTLQVSRDFSCCLGH